MILSKTIQSFTLIFYGFPPKKPPLNPSTFSYNYNNYKLESSPTKSNFFITKNRSWNRIFPMKFQQPKHASSSETLAPKRRPRPDDAASDSSKVHRLQNFQSSSSARIHNDGPMSKYSMFWTCTSKVGQNNYRTNND